MKRPVKTVAATSKPMPRSLRFRSLFASSHSNIRDYRIDFKTAPRIMREERRAGNGVRSLTSDVVASRRHVEGEIEHDLGPGDVRRRGREGRRARQRVDANAVEGALARRLHDADPKELSLAAQAQHVDGLAGEAVGRGRVAQIAHDPVPERVEIAVAPTLAAQI